MRHHITAEGGSGRLGHLAPGKRGPLQRSCETQPGNPQWQPRATRNVQQPARQDTPAASAFHSSGAECCRQPHHCDCPSAGQLLRRTLRRERPLPLSSTNFCRHVHRRLSTSQAQLATCIGQTPLRQVKGALCCAAADALWPLGLRHHPGKDPPGRRR